MEENSEEVAYLSDTKNYRTLRIQATTSLFMLISTVRQKIVEEINLLQADAESLARQLEKSIQERIDEGTRWVDPVGAGISF